MIKTPSRRRYPTERTRAGNALVVILVLGLLIAGALSSLSFLTHSDVSSTEKLLREVAATSIAESVAAQFEAQVNRRPWSDRFWWREAQASGALAAAPDQPVSYGFDGTSKYLKLSDETTHDHPYEIAGVVKDLPSAPRSYRIYVQVTFRGDRYTFSWDKLFQESFLGNMNHDSTQNESGLELTEADGTAPAGGVADQILDDVRNRQDTAPPASDPSSSTGVLDLLNTLHEAASTLERTTVTPDPSTAPSHPSGF